MSLDLSYGKGNGGSSMGEDGDDKDDVIVTLALPGGHDLARRCSEPIIIASDSEDSDTDVTIVSDNIVSDFSTLGPLRGNNIRKNNSFGEVLGIPISGPADDTDDDCFVSFSTGSNNASSRVQGVASCRGGQAGIKRIFEDSSSQSSVDSPISPLDKVVQGKDAFLSDASSQSSAEDIGLVLTSNTVADQSLLASAIGAPGSANTVSLPVVRPTGLEVMNSFKRKLFNLPHSAAVDVNDLSSVKELSSVTASVPSDFVDVSSKRLPSLLVSSAPSSLTYSISQLLSYQKANSSSIIVSSAVPVKPCATAVRPVTDLNSLFCVPSFDSLYPDVSTSALPGNSLSLPSSKLATSKLSVSDTDDLLSPRCRRRSSVVKSYSSTKIVSDTNSVMVNKSSRSSAGGSSALSDMEWTVHNKGGCKVLLRRSVSQSATDPSASTSTSSLGQMNKRCRLMAGPPAIVSDDDKASAACYVIDNVERAMCYGCRLRISTNQLSYCMAGHGCCGQCLQCQVKTLLASGKKGTLKCRYTACTAFYLVSQLHNSLPSMVVEILEEKLEREYCDNADKLLLKEIGKGLIAAFSDDDSDDRDGDGDVSVKNEAPNILELPKSWESMNYEEEYRLVELFPGNDSEYSWVTALFHETMKRPRAQIVTIKRVQNQILWQFFMVKKKQMERDSNRPVVEKNLFHGTCRNVVDSICRNNFDWRLCGTHGTMYGQGSYFALDAAYSHMYTDLPQPRAAHHHAPSGATAAFTVSHPPSHHQLTASSSSATAQMMLQAISGGNALQSCRYAHLQSTPSYAAGPPPPLGQPSSVYVPMSPAFYFGPSSAPLFPPNTPPPQHTSPSHVHCMFLARVLVGEYTTGKSSYRKPPPVDSAQPFGRCFDSCVNDNNKPTIFVIFNNAQCYPEYIVEYTNKSRDM